jgi:type IV pilus assembly protein PilQ
VPSQQEVNIGKLKRISVKRHSFGGGFLSRMEIDLEGEQEFSVASDSADKSKLVVTFVKPQHAEAAVVTPTAASAQETIVADSAVKSAVIQKLDEKPVVQQVVPAEAAPSAPETVVQQPSSAETTPKSEKVDGQKILTAIDVQQDGVDIMVSGAADNFKTFKMTKPDRIVVDIFGARSSIKAQSVDVNSFGVSRVRIGITPDKVRLVFDPLKDLLPEYQIAKSEKGLKVSFAASASKSAKDMEPQKGSPESPAPVTVKKSARQKGPGTVDALDFQVKGEFSQLSVMVSGACTAGSPVKVAKGMTLTFKNCQIPRNLQRFIDTSSFPSVVQGITPYSIKGKAGSDTRFLVKLRADAPTTLTQEGEQYVWSFKNTEIPPAKAEKTESAPRKNIAREDAVQEELTAESGTNIKLTDRQGTNYSPKYFEKKTYSGRKVSLEFSDADVRKIFQLIAEVSNLNFLIADDVTGTISIKLVNVPWDQALDVILDTKNLEMKQEGSIVQIKPKGKFKSIEQEEADAKKAKERLMPLVTEIFDVNFAGVSDVERQFTSMKSERGTISRDDRTNRVIVKDVQAAIDEMRFILKNIDMPEKQVLIEARIVEASSRFSRDLGIQWSMHAKDDSASTLNVERADAGWGGVISLPPPLVGFQPADRHGLGLGISFGTLGSEVRIDMRLSAAAAVGQVKIISSPKVVTLNNKQAKISQGSALYLPTTSAEGTKQEKVDATLSLEVKPHITPDGSIVMTITAKNDSPDTPPPGATAAINKKEANTELLVKNGETTVIGGIFVDQDGETNSGVPFLMDIPMIGWLFKSSTKIKNKTELLIFITPRIIS